MLPEFVTCATAEEKLLMVIIERLEALEGLVQELHGRVNPLTMLTPASTPSPLAEAQRLARDIESTVPCPFTERLQSYALTSTIVHPSNVDLLRRQGFKVTQTFNTAGLPKSIHTVAWQHPAEAST